MEKITERIKTLEYNVAIYSEILKYRQDKKILSKLDSTKKLLDLNLNIYLGSGGKYQVKKRDSIKGLEKDWKVRKGVPLFNGTISRELWLNGLLFKDRLTVAEAMEIMEALA